VKRVSLLKDAVAEPLRGEWVEKLPAGEDDTESTTAGGAIATGLWAAALAIGRRKRLFVDL